MCYAKMLVFTWLVLSVILSWFMLTSGTSEAAAVKQTQLVAVLESSFLESFLLRIFSKVVGCY